MSKKAMSWICALVFLIFIGILDYPFLARIYNEKIQEQAAVRYEKGTGGLNISGQEEACLLYTSPWPNFSIPISR